jgi:hypothetical protein
VAEYQYYEFLAIDRPLDARQLAELRALSTRARISPSRFVNTYQWGDFRGDPRALMTQYFDAFLYTANWGTRRLMLRLPSRLLDPSTARRYCHTDSASAWAAGKIVILDLSREDQDGSWEDEEYGEESLGSIIPARAELATGDLRLLYLAWLLSVESGELADDDAEPPIPPGMAALNAPLRSLADFLRLDEDLIAVAAEASEEQKDSSPSPQELKRWVAVLPARERDALLVRLVLGDDVHLRTELLRRSHGESTDVPQHREPRTVAELRDAAAARRVERERLAAIERARKRARRERDAALARDKRLEELALHDEQAWGQVDASIATKKPAGYDSAVELLSDLRAVSERKGRPEAFAKRFAQLREQHLKKSSLLDRFDRAGLGRLDRDGREPS